MKRVGLAAASLLTLAVASELRIKRTAQPLTDDWRRMPIEPRGATRLGISIRSPQLEAFGLDPTSAVNELLAYPFDVVRLGAYWSRIEPAPGVLNPAELDAQIEAAERANKQVIVCVGAVKTFGYPELFAPRHVVESFPERIRIRANAYASVVGAAIQFIQRIVERYRRSTAVIAWQVEHESVDPLGFEHSWRLDAGFVEAEVNAVRQADPSRPILMNGFLPVSIPGSLSQWLQTRDQGDSLHVAERLADIVGVDFYPRIGLFRAGAYGAYLESSRSPWQLRRLDALLRSGRRVMLTEGQAEPWESVLLPPSDPRSAPSSCTPEHVIDNYNQCLRRARRLGATLEAYLFWGAEYWLSRQRSGDSTYLRAFDRVLTGH